MEQVMDTKFGTNVSNRMLLNAAKCHGYSFYCFWVIKGKPTGGTITVPDPIADFRIKVTITGMSLRMKSKMSPPFMLRSFLKGLLKPWSINWSIGKVPSKFVSEIMSTSEQTNVFLWQAPLSINRYTKYLEF